MMVKSKQVFILIMVTLPIFIILTSIRIALTPSFLEIEYRMPGFPKDPYGFSFEERLNWAKISLQYLLNREGIEFLSDQRILKDTALFNSRELGHMEDVKQLVQFSLKLWWILLFCFIATIFLSLSHGWVRDFWYWISRGGWLTILIIIIILLGVFFSFNLLFTGFHRIFFEGDSWLFYTSDTLIRLFPERFWQDVFIWLGGLSLLQAFIAIKVGHHFGTK